MTPRQSPLRTTMARRRTTILPATSFAEAFETTRIHPVAGRTGDRTVFVTTRPCRAPHHTLSAVGLIGGQVPRPGDVSLAHQGMLVLDERPEFKRHVLEVLRQPLEESVLPRQSPVRHRSRRIRRTCGPSAADTAPHGTAWELTSPLEDSGASPDGGGRI